MPVLRRAVRLMIVSAVVVSLIPIGAVGQIDCGNVNGDSFGAVDLSDLIYLVNYLFQGGEKPHSMWASNTDGSSDGSVDLSDLIFFVNYLFNGGSAPACLWVPDIDGNQYRAVRIGSQMWLAENLRVTHYRNGDSIPNVTEIADWQILVDGAYVDYDNDAALVDIYGRLYNWFAAVDGRGLAPAGWHVPTDEDWKVLERSLGMNSSELDVRGWRGSTEADSLKDTVIWTDPHTAATNSTEFAAVPGGNRGAINSLFTDIGEVGLFWIVTDSSEALAWSRRLESDSSKIERNVYRKRHGFSIRCVWDSLVTSK